MPGREEFRGQRNRGQERLNQGQRPREDRSNTEELQKLVREAMKEETDRDGDKLIDCAQKIAEILVKRNNVSSSRLRKLYTEARKIALTSGKAKSNAYEINLLRARLAYTAARESGLKEFQQIMDIALQEVKQPQGKYERFLHLFEAIVAYHRLYGGRE